VGGSKAARTITEENLMAEQVLRSRFVIANGVRTHYTEAGADGPVLIALHGASPGSSGEGGFGRLMLLLAQHYRVIALDAVGGYGKTDMHAPVPYGIQSRVDHLEDFVDALCLPAKFSIIGNSQGAWTAAQYAILHTDRINKLLWVAGATLPAALGLPTPPTEGTKTFATYDGTREAMRRLLQSLLFDQALITDDLIDRRQATATQPGAEAARKAFREGTQLFTTDPRHAFKYSIMRHTLRELTTVVPTVCIWGENDRVSPPALGKELAKLLPAVPFHWIPDAGHQVQNDQPDRVAKIIFDFLGVPHHLDPG